MNIVTYVIKQHITNDRLYTGSTSQYTDFILKKNISEDYSNYFEG